MSATLTAIDFAEVMQPYNIRILKSQLLSNYATLNRKDTIMVCSYIVFLQCLYIHTQQLYIQAIESTHATSTSYIARHCSCMGGVHVHSYSYIASLITLHFPYVN